MLAKRCLDLAGPLIARDEAPASMSSAVDRQVATAIQD